MPYIKKEKKKLKEYIKEYSKHKILCEFKKKKSAYSGIIVEDLNDPWFCYAIWYKTKSGEIGTNSMFIKGDYDQWIRAFEIDGFEIVIK
jgi:hypothetical protein